MKLLNSRVLILFVLCISVSQNACKKDELSDFETETSNLKVYSNVEMDMPIQILTVANRIVSFYGIGDFSGEIRAMITDLDGNYIKDVLVGEIATVFSFYAAVNNKNEIVIRNGNSLILMDLNGDVLSETIDFFALINNYLVYGMLINDAGNYVLYGQYKSYAFIVEYSPSGQLLYKTLYFNQKPDVHYFTSGVPTSDGGYLMYGCQFNTQDTDPIYYLLTKISATGDIVWRKRYAAGAAAGEFGGQGVFSGAILDMRNGEYLLFSNSPNREREELYARVYKVNADGDMLDSLRLISSGLSMIAGTKAQSHTSFPWQPVSNGVARTSGGGAMGLMITDNLGPAQLGPSYSKPHQSFRFKLTSTLELVEISEVQRAYSDYITSMCELPDGRLVAFGMIQSLGQDFKPMLIFYDN